LQKDLNLQKKQKARNAKQIQKCTSQAAETQKKAKQKKCAIYIATKLTYPAMRSGDVNA